MPATHEKSSIRNPQILSIYRKKGRSEIAPVNHARTAGNDAVRPKKKEAELTQAELKRLLHYDPETGVFTWLVKANDNMVTGQVAGTLRAEGYWRISLKNKLYYSHRLAWLYIYGYLPPQGVDHIDGVKSNNQLSNLRIADKSENGQNKYTPPSNSTSGFLGVSLRKNTKRWRAVIKINRKQLYLGQFSTPEQAHQAYLDAKREIHPFCMI